MSFASIQFVLQISQVNEILRFVELSNSFKLTLSLKEQKRQMYYFNEVNENQFFLIHSLYFNTTENFFEHSFSYFICLTSFFSIHLIES